MRKHKGQFKKGSDRAKEAGHKGGISGNHSTKGFASMSPEQRKEAGRRGGKRTYELGKNPWVKKDA